MSLLQEDYELIEALMHVVSQETEASNNLKEMLVKAIERKKREEPHGEYGSGEKIDRVQTGKKLKVNPVNFLIKSSHQDEAGDGQSEDEVYDEAPEMDEGTVCLTELKHINDEVEIISEAQDDKTNLKNKSSNMAEPVLLSNGPSIENETQENNIVHSKKNKIPNRTSNKGEANHNSKSNVKKKSKKHTINNGIPSYSKIISEEMELIEIPSSDEDFHFNLQEEGNPKRSVKEKVKRTEPIRKKSNKEKQRDKSKERLNLKSHKVLTRVKPRETTHEKHKVLKTDPVKVQKKNQTRNSNKTDLMTESNLRKLKDVKTSHIHVTNSLAAGIIAALAERKECSLLNTVDFRVLNKRKERIALNSEARK